MKKMKMLISGLMIILLTFTFANVEASSNINIEGMEVFKSNPALNTTDKNYEISFKGYGFIGNNAIKSEYLNQYLNESKKEEILSNVGNDDLAIIGNGVQSIEFGYKNYGVFYGLEENGLATLSKDALELMSIGNEIGREYIFEGTKGELAAYTKGGISYSNSSSKLADRMDSNKVLLGFNFGLLSGAIAKYNGIGSITTNYQDTITGSGSVKAEYAEEGSGYVLDLGINTIKNEKFSWGASISNIGSISSDSGRFYEYEYDPDAQEFKETKDQPLDKLVYSLPTKINVNTKYHWKKNTILYNSYTITSYSSGYQDHRISGALEYNKLTYLPLSIGTTYSTLQNDFTFSAGVGLKYKYLKLDVVFSDLKYIFDGSRSIALGVSTSFSF
ncbi:MAG: hypothetical protein K9K76_07025 [Halanaerobiales bacterium]|nr:hypothetical protein [Halanaerobiales bacterium]